MRRRSIQTSIKATNNYCTDREKNEACDYMKEAYLCNKFCELFKQRLIFDEEVKEYIRPIECIAVEQGRLPNK